MVLEDANADCRTLQKIQYAKGKSDTIAKLDGTYKMPIAAGTETTSTELQQSIFGAPPSSLLTPVKPSTSGEKAAGATNGGMEVDGREDGGGEDRGKGVKRAREEESDDEEAPMEEDSDAPMEASSDEESEESEESE